MRDRKNTMPAVLRIWWDAEQNDFCVQIPPDAKEDWTLIHKTFFEKVYEPLMQTLTPSFVDELRMRGYDLSTFVMEIQMKGIEH